MCSHKKLTKRDKRQRKWLAPGSLPALEKIVKSQYLLGDLKHLTNFNHIGTLKYITLFTTNTVQNDYTFHTLP